MIIESATGGINMTEQNHLDNVIAKTIAEVEQGKEDLFQNHR